MKNFSQTYLSVIVSILALVLPKLGITIGSEALTSTAQTLIVIGSGLWILIRRHRQGDVTVGGFRK